LLNCGGAVLEELLSPVLRRGRLNATLITGVGDRHMFDLATQDGELLESGVMLAPRAQERPPIGNSEARCFHFGLVQNKVG
jgi:hypothetical protein